MALFDTDSAVAGIVDVDVLVVDKMASIDLVALAVYWQANNYPLAIDSDSDSNSNKMNGQLAVEGEKFVDQSNSAGDRLVDKRTVEGTDSIEVEADSLAEEWENCTHQLVTSDSETDLQLEAIEWMDCYYRSAGAYFVDASVAVRIAIHEPA